MDKDRSYNARGKIYPYIQRKGIEDRVNVVGKYPNREYYHCYTEEHGIYNILCAVKIQILLVSGSYTSNAYNKKCGYLTEIQVPVIINYPLFHPMMNFGNNTAKYTKLFRGYGIYKKLNYYGNINECPESFVYTLQFLTFFHVVIFAGGLIVPPGFKWFPISNAT